MKFFNILKIILLLFCSSMQAAFSQESVLPAGGFATGAGGTVSFSVGQVPCHVVTGTEGTITEGVEQPYEILIMEGIAEEPGIVLDCKVSPNPAETFVKLVIVNHPSANLSYQLCNLTGIVLQSVTISGSEMIIPMKDLSQGIYLLIVAEKETPIKKFKIIKK